MASPTIDGSVGEKEDVVVVDATQSTGTRTITESSSGAPSWLALTPRVPFAEEMETRKARQELTDFVEIDHAQSRDRAQRLLYGTIRSWQKEAELKHLCLVCGEDLPYGKSWTRLLAHVLGLPLNKSSMTDCEARLSTVLERGASALISRGAALHRIPSHARADFTTAQRTYVIEQLKSANTRLLAEGKGPAPEATTTGKAGAKVKAKEKIFELPAKEAHDMLLQKIADFLVFHDIAPHAIHGAGHGSLFAVCETARQVPTGEWPKRFNRKDFGTCDGVLATPIARRAESAADDFKQRLEHMSNNGWGVTLCVDSMTKNDRCTNNSVVCSASGDMFVQSTHTEYDSKNILWHEEDLQRSLDVIGKDLVSFICTDGERACLQAAKNICNAVEDVDIGGVMTKRLKHPKMLHQRCATHGYSLLIKDAFDDDTTKSPLRMFERTFALVLEVNEFFRMHRFAMRHRKKVLEKMEGKRPRKLARYVQPRYGSIFYVEERFLENWSALEKALIDIVDDGSIGQVDREKAREYKCWLQQKCFRDAVRLSVAMLEPIVKALRMTDVKHPNLSLVVEFFFTARKDCLKALEDAWKKLENSEADTQAKEFYARLGWQQYVDALKQKFNERQKDVISTWAWAANALSAPRNYTVEDEEANEKEFADARRNAVIAVIEREWPEGSEKHTKALIEYDNFAAKHDSKRGTGFFGSKLTVDIRFPKGNRNETPQQVCDRRLKQNDTYWMYQQPRGSLLAEISMRLARGFAGQGSAERANKAVARIYTKVRNRQSPVLTDAFLKMRYYIQRLREDAAATIAADKHDVDPSGYESATEDSEDERDENGNRLGVFWTDDEYAHVRLRLPDGQIRDLRPSAMKHFSLLDLRDVLYEAPYRNENFGHIPGGRLPWKYGDHGGVRVDHGDAETDSSSSRLAEAQRSEAATQRPSENAPSVFPLNESLCQPPAAEADAQIDGLTPQSPVVKTREQIAAAVEAAAERANQADADGDELHNDDFRRGNDRCAKCISTGVEKCAHEPTLSRPHARETRMNKRRRV